MSIPHEFASAAPISSTSTSTTPISAGHTGTHDAYTAVSVSPSRSSRNTTKNEPADPLILTARPPTSRVLIIRLNRPRVLNALSTTLIEHLLSALHQADTDPDVGAVVITGDDKAFAAGADIKELAKLSFTSAYLSDYLQGLSEGISAIKKPVVAAVSGYALGGGLELALACDTIYASTTATFGLPEVKLGTIPGAGGTQRLVRAVGKAKAMHLILTGETLSSTEALSVGLVAKVFPPEQLLDAAVDAARIIASYSTPILAMAKEAVLQADQLSLSDGLRFERRLYHATFATADFPRVQRLSLRKGIRSGRMLDRFVF